MKRYDATFSAASFVGSFVVSASIMSAVHYHTFDHLSGLADWILYPGGLLVLMSGVIILVIEKGAVVGPSFPREDLSDSNGSEQSEISTARVEMVRNSLSDEIRLPKWLHLHVLNTHTN